MGRITTELSILHTRYFEWDRIDNCAYDDLQQSCASVD